jgi:hypothetical protein
MQAKVLTKNEARRIAVNVARLPWHIGKPCRVSPLALPTSHLVFLCSFACLMSQALVAVG